MIIEIEHLLPFHLVRLRFYELRKYMLIQISLFQRSNNEYIEQIKIKEKLAYYGVKSLTKSLDKLLSGEKILNKN
jgi:hypothetical protein